MDIFQIQRSIFITIQFEDKHGRVLHIILLNVGENFDKNFLIVARNLEKLSHPDP